MAKNGYISMMKTTYMDRLRGRLQAAKGSWTAIATETGVRYQTVFRIATGVIPDPKVSAADAITRWLDANGERAKVLNKRWGYERMPNRTPASQQPPANESAS